MQMQPGGDTRESEDFSLLDDATLDNLTDHLNSLGIDGEESKGGDAKRDYGKRRLTKDEQGELRGTTLVRKKNAADKN